MFDPRTAFIAFDASSMTDGPTLVEVDAFIARYGWFAPARVLRRRLTGANDRVLDLVAPWRGGSSLDVPGIDIRALLASVPGEVSVAAAPTPDERIERFLAGTPRRIVAEEGEPDTEVRTAPELSDEDDVVSESLAEVYFAQGLYAEAVAIYRKLSLLNPEKSVYFAELIGKIENNN